MIESDADSDTVARRERRQIQQLVFVSRRRFLDQCMFTRLDHGTQDRRLAIGRRRDDDGVDIGTADELTPIGADVAVAGGRCGQRGARAIHVDAMNQACARQIARPLLAHRATADDS